MSDRAVATDATHVTLSFNQRVVRFAWEDVTQVSAFVIDYFSHDALAIGFTLGRPQDQFVTDEDCQGWPAFLVELNRRLGLEENWAMDFVREPFNRREVVLWRKS
jgi:hypothetical protein